MDHAVAPAPTNVRGLNDLLAQFHIDCTGLAYMAVGVGLAPQGRMRRVRTCGVQSPVIATSLHLTTVEITSSGELAGRFFGENDVGALLHHRHCS